MTKAEQGSEPGEPTVAKEGAPGTEGAPGPRRQSVGWRLLAVLAGLVVGLALAEALFAYRDGGAFPHLHVYVADAEQGLRLRPHATQRLVFGGAAVTTVRTNALGFRGDDWPAPAGAAPRPARSAAVPAATAPAPSASAPATSAPAAAGGRPQGEILVVGDSQVFGLGVEEGETFSARLATALGVPVLNAGVPTWGPLEYDRELGKLLEARKPALVIWVVNAYNDFFEADRPNLERHAALDGWAVRRELAPEPWAFPGREWLFSRSHAVYALRRWLYGRRPDPNALGTPSEGTWRDLLGTSAPVAATREANAGVEREYLHVRDDELRMAEQALVAAQAHVEKLAQAHLPSVVTSPGDGVSLGTIRSTPGDIVDYGDGGEFARPGPVTVDHIRLAVRARARAVALLRERAVKEAEQPEAKEIEQALAREDAYVERLRRVRDQPLTLVRSLSPLSRRVAEAQELCQRAGAELFVLALPMDVQVSREEWRKYATEPIELEPTRVLLTDVVDAAEAGGARALDATDVLRAAGPGQFLPRDLHLSSSGHATVAQALVTALDAYRPRLPRGGLPPGRSRAPTVAEWTSVGETLVYGSSARACATKRIREWLSVWCTEGDGYSSMLEAAHALRILQGGRGEAIVARWSGPLVEREPYTYRERVVPNKQRTQLVLVAPVLPGDRLVVDFFWPGKKSTLVVELPRELEAQTVQFEKFAKVDSEPMPLSDAARELCACHQKLTGARDCLGLAAMPDADCHRTWGSDCAPLLACSSGDPASAPRCLAGSANAGALDHCFPLCGPGKSCAAGAFCVDWQGGDVCLPAPLTEKSPRVESVVVPAESSEKTIALARDLLKAGAATVRDCKLVNENQPNIFFDVYDQCALDGATATAAIAAARAFTTHVAERPGEVSGPARILARRATLFADWIELAQARGFTRGTLPAFAELCGVWNEWRPKEAVDPHGAGLVAQFRAGLRTRGRDGPPRWVTCKTGPCL